MNPKLSTMNVQCLFKKQRRAVEAGQEQELTLDEINAEIRAAKHYPSSLHVITPAEFLSLV